MVSIGMFFTGLLSPFLVCLILPVVVYQLWLIVVAIQAAHRMTTSKAVFAALLSIPAMAVVSNIISAIFSTLTAPLIRSWLSSLPR